jgi:catalase
VFPDTPEQEFEGIDLLDATKLVPEELAPVQPIGRLTLNRNPTNFFAETEQVAFHVGHLVRGIEVTDDPLLHGRLFSYLDTQLTRLGGPNFSQIPINRPVAPVNDNHRDGFMQQAVPHGRTPYLPNGVGGGCPFLASDAEGGYAHVPQVVEGPKTRERAETDDDVQARMFWRSLTSVEQDHVVNAYRFELGKVDVPAVVDRMLVRLARVDPELATLVAGGLGLVAPDVDVVRAEVDPSPALRMVRDETFPADGRVVQILASDGCDLVGIRALRDELLAAGLTVHVVATHKGAIAGAGRKPDELVVDRSFLTACSAEADALVVADRTSLAGERAVLTYVQEAYRHHKTIAAWGDGTDVLDAAGVEGDGAGIVVAPRPTKAMARAVVAALGKHRHWERAPGPLLAARALVP